jgi:DNA-binding phage protein
MNKDFILKNTRSYDEWLIEHLKDPEEAQTYLEASLEEYEKDGDTTALLLALRSVAQAQGGIGKLAKWTEGHVSNFLED